VSKGAGSKGKPVGRRAPRWAVVLTVIGALLMLGSGGILVAGELVFNHISGAIPQEDLFGEAEPAETYGEDVEGPLDILLVGLDTRPSRPDETPRADAIMVIHVNRTLDKAYMISLPRDTIVEIPADPASEYLGGTDRINSAMFHGADPNAGESGPNIPRGFALLADTVRQLTGIEDFAAGAVMRFEGFSAIVDAMGGVSVQLNERIVSEHRQPDGTHRPLGCGSYCGPQMVYEAGSPPCGDATSSGAFECDLEGWMALDVVRQRYGVEGGDYGRQENQQRVLRAILDKAVSRGMITNPGALNNLLQAVGDAMIFDGQGNDPIDFAFALRSLRPNTLVDINLPGTNVGTGAAYQGEELDPVADEVFAALRRDTLDQFLVEHRELAR
jgi:anionic cell wall polymer biosynthesis LytR-Cps2A-Psr (LCP) family protein